MSFFFLNDPAPPEISPLPQHDALPIPYERAHPPSLQGFVHWLRRGGAQVKREADSGADAVRIMTVHGAKGLEAPIVILPDLDRKSTRLNSSHANISYAVFCLKKKTIVR